MKEKMPFVILCTYLHVVYVGEVTQMCNASSLFLRKKKQKWSKENRHIALFTFNGPPNSLIFLNFTHFPKFHSFA